MPAAEPPPQRPRAAHVLHWDGPGGGPVVMRRLMESLRDGWEPVAIVGGDGPLAAWCRENGIAVACCRLHPFVFAPWGLVQVARALRRFRPEVAVLHGQWAGPVGALAARWAGVPRSVYIAHCPAFYHSTSLWRALRNYVAERIPCAWCDRVVVLSDGSRTNYLVRRWVPPEKLAWIPNGTDPAEAPGAEAVAAHRRGQGWDPASCHFVFAGRLDDQKRVDWLLRAWQRAGLHGRAHLWIVGGGRGLRALQAQARRLGVEDSCTFAGPRAEARLWIAAADVVVLGSLYEGHALVPLEALASGRPVAATAVDGITDTVRHGENGLLAPPSDLDAMAWNLVRMMDPELRQRLGAAAAASAASFTWDRSVESYRRLLAGLHRSAAPHPSAVGALP